MMNDPYSAPAAPVGADRRARRRPLWNIILAVPCFCLGPLLLLEAGSFVVEHGYRYWPFLAGQAPMRQAERTMLVQNVGTWLCGLLACTTGWYFWTNRRLTGLIWLLTGLLMLALTAWAIAVSSSL